MATNAWIAFFSSVFILLFSLVLHTKCPCWRLWTADPFSNAVHIFRNLFWKICPLFGKILITCLKCSRASFSPSSYSEKMRWGRGWENPDQNNSKYGHFSSNAIYWLEYLLQRLDLVNSWVIKSRFFNFPENEKYVGKVLQLIKYMKARFFQISIWYILRTLQSLKSCLVWEVCDMFLTHNSDSVFLLTVYFLKFGLIVLPLPPSAVNDTMTKVNVYLYRALPYTKAQFF